MAHDIHLIYPVNTEVLFFINKCISYVFVDVLFLSLCSLMKMLHQHRPNYTNILQSSYNNKSISALL